MYRIERVESQTEKYRIYKRPGETLQQTFVAFLLRLPADAMATFLMDRKLEEMFLEGDYVEIEVPQPGLVIRPEVVYLQQCRTKYAVSFSGDEYVSMDSVVREPNFFYHDWEINTEDYERILENARKNFGAASLSFYYTIEKGEQTISRLFNGERRKYGSQTFFCARITEAGDVGNLRDVLEIEKEKTEIISSLFDDWIFEYDIEQDIITTISGSRKQYRMGQGGGSRSLQLQDLHPEDVDKFSESYRNMLTRADSGYAEARILVDGKYRWISMTTRVLTDRKGIARLVLGKISDIDEKKREELRLQERAMKDSLTGLLNRAAFREQAEKILDHMIQTGDGNPVMMIIDIDRFKQINDTYGHLYGDTIIMTLTEALTKVFGSESLIGRFGGDEFTVLLNHYDKDEVARQILEVKDYLKREVTQDEVGSRITCSVGVSLFGQDGTTIDELVRNADNALYYVKENGRDNFAFCTEEMKKWFSEEYRIKYTEQPIPAQTRVAEEITEYALELLEGTSELKNAVNALLMKIGKRFGLSCVSIREYDREKPKISYLWTADGAFENRSKQQIRLEPDEWNAIREQYMSENIVEITDVEELPKDSGQYKIYHANCIRSLLQSPLMTEGAVFGYISYVDNKPREWKEENKKAMIMLSRLIGNYMAREKDYQRIRQKVELMTSFDEVTGLLKFDKFKEVAQEILDQGGPYRYGLASVDFVHFKYFNEVYGFRSGDTVLKDFADMVVKHNPRAVAACRDYADNFVIMVRVQSEETFLENIRVYNQTFISNQERMFPDSRLELCCGAYVITNPEAGIVQAIDNANMARKILKESGEGGIRPFRPEMKINRLREIALLHMIEEAMEKNEFQVYLQPKISMRTGKLVGAETLARWIKPDGTVIMPKDFIPPLENTGKIVGLDINMYEKTVQILKDWREKGYELIPVSVNFSRHHFKNENLMTLMEEYQQEYGVPNDLIDIEITESAFLDNQEALSRRMREFKEHGFLISIDDFGTGFSSLSMLTEIAADVVKLDKNFLNKGDSVSIRNMLSNVIRLIKDNGMLVLCEGVEYPDQLEFLTEAGCDIGQGYYYDKPMPIHEFEEKYLR